ncbi:kinase-like domain-containing protein [Biscogniauxia sp. FL1348]|nr:kinase-like domain-containing protein [Biscogniauxia sp. FL1348]
MSDLNILFNIAQQVINKKHYVLEKAVVAGNGGGIVRFMSKTGAPPSPPMSKNAPIQPSSSGSGTRYVAKIWLRGLAAQAQEIQHLKALAWSEHVVKLVDLPKNPFNDNQFVAMEFIPGGTLDDFKKEVGEEIPSAVLWRIFLCLVKACVAMAYPTKSTASGLVEEEIYSDVEPDNLAHCNLHPRNVLFHGYDLTTREHELSPIVKLVDFEHAQRLDKVESVNKQNVKDWDIAFGYQKRRDAGRRNPGIDHNILSIGRIMAHLIGPVQDRFLSVVECRMRLEDPHISPSDELLDIIRRCLAVDPKNRPRLEALLPRVRARVYHEKTKRYMDDYLQKSRAKQGI